MVHTTTEVRSAPCARVLRGRSSDSPRGDERAGRAPRGSNAVTLTMQSRSRRPDVVAVRPSRGRRLGEERAPTRHTPQPRSAVRSAPAVSPVHIAAHRGTTTAIAAHRFQTLPQSSQTRSSSPTVRLFPFGDSEFLFVCDYFVCRGFLPDFLSLKQGDRGSLVSAPCS